MCIPTGFLGGLFHPLNLDNEYRRAEQRVGAAAAVGEVGGALPKKTSGGMPRGEKTQGRGRGRGSGGGGKGGRRAGPGPAPWRRRWGSRSSPGRRSGGGRGAW
ncbi:unnamed protein product [Spirodela intermedia]|uniref:Uncharacterized protein n=1 Tax=Spirodela intermedia TaxID=51605 RepID=A0A7I8JW24_SPIIN|nr:unnamed protein product [Spirodela intermedia]CAA6673662.1 unnamed protein product [Spirodela intermedia]